MLCVLVLRVLALGNVANLPANQIAQLHKLLHGLSQDLPFNKRVKLALQRLEAAKIVG